MGDLLVDDIRLIAKAAYVVLGIDFHVLLFILGV